MASCQEVEEVMSLVLDELAGEDEHTMLKTHRAGCERCAMTWDAMSQVSGMLWHTPLIAPPAGFVGRVMDRLKARQLKKRSQQRGILLMVGLAAFFIMSGLLAAMCIGGLWIGVPALREALMAFIAFIGQAREGVGALLRGLGVPFRLMGPGPLALMLGCLALVVASATGLWAWALVRVERGSRAIAVGNG